MLILSAGYAPRHASSASSPGSSRGRRSDSYAVNCFVEVGFAISLPLSLITRVPAFSTENDGWPRLVTFMKIAVLWIEPSKTRMRLCRWSRRTIGRVWSSEARETVKCFHVACRRPPKEHRAGLRLPPELRLRHREDASLRVGLQVDVVVGHLAAIDCGLGRQPGADWVAVLVDGEQDLVVVHVPRIAPHDPHCCRRSERRRRCRQARRSPGARQSPRRTCSSRS